MMPSPTDADRADLGSSMSLMCPPGFAEVRFVYDPVSPKYPTITPSSFPPSVNHPVSPAHPVITSPSPSFLSKPCRRTSLHNNTKWCDVGQVTIDMLPEDGLLEIFDWYLGGNDFYNIEGWQTLVHVCRNWRNVVFRSPRRLKLQLFCTGKNPVRKILDIWPPLPIIISGYCHKITGEDNIVAALEHNDRVCRIHLQEVSSSLWEAVLAATQEPFPALTDMELHTSAKEPLTVFDSFLGGSAPNLRHLRLSCVPSQGLPKLLSSAIHLVTLHLLRIPHSGYISPEAMVTALSALTGLKKYCLEFRSPRSCPDRGRRRPPPPARSVLPALTEFIFAGASEYLEEFVARVDAPLLDRLEIMFFRQLIFHTPRLAQFIGRTPNLMVHDEAHVIFSNFNAEFTLPRTIRGLNFEIECSESDWQLSMLAQICSSSLPRISSLVHLYIHENEDNQSLQPRWQDDIENIQWLELLHPFTTVKTLYLSRDIAARIAPALGELVGARATEVLPALQSLFLEELRPSGPVQEAIDMFVATRQLSNHPIVVSHWDRKQGKRSLISEKVKCHTNEDSMLDDTFLSSEKTVLGLMKSYVRHFNNPNDPDDRSFDPHPTDYPVGELEFPNSGATERYILLVPRNEDHYNPILDLERTLYTILEHYLTPEQQSLFGTLPQDSAFLGVDPTRTTNHLRMLRRAMCLCDGPLFVRTLDNINSLLRILKYPPFPLASDAFAPPQPNAFRAAVADWSATGLPREIALRIVEETYQRTDGLRTHEPSHYLMPSLVSRLLSITRAGPGMLLLDLGSGVGNVVLQAALQSGCSAFGVEVMEKLSEIAREQRAQMMMRARMWGVRMGDIELEHANILESARVNELMARADIVLVNNKVFGEKLNQAIRPKFLDLKEGALIISLEPFVVGTARGSRVVNERNLDDISVVFDVCTYDYLPMDVSWGPSAGKFYVHRVDRAGYADVRARFEASRTTRSLRK